MNLSKVKQSNPGAAKALALIGLSVEDQYLPTVNECDTAKAAWDALASIYKSRSNARVLILKRQLNSITLQDSEPLIKYIGRAQALRDQLAAIGQSVDESDVVLAVLNGLPRQYNTLVTVIENTDPMPNLNAVLSKLLLVEQRSPAGASTTSETALYTNVQKPGFSGRCPSSTSPLIRCWLTCLLRPCLALSTSFAARAWVSSRQTVASDWLWILLYLHELGHCILGSCACCILRSCLLVWHKHL